MSGGRPRRVSDAEILAVFDNSPDPVLTTNEVTTHVELTSQGVYKRLENLVDADLLTAKKVGAKSKIYWLTTEGKAYLERKTDT